MLAVGFGTTIRRRREAAGLTHEALGALVGADADLVDRWEWEEVVPARSQVARLAEVLRVAPADLVPEVVVVVLPPEAAIESQRSGDPFAAGPAATIAEHSRPPVHDRLANAWSGFRRLLRGRADPNAAPRGSAPSGEGPASPDRRGSSPTRAPGSTEAVSGGRWLRFEVVGEMPDHREASIDV